MRFTARTISADSISRGNIGYLLSDKLENYHHVFPHLMFQNTPVSKVILSEVSDFVNSKPKNTTRDVEVRNFGWSPEKIYNKYIIGTEYEDPKDIKAKVLRATREELTAMEKAEKYKH
jgi:hypothetical protein